MIYAVGKYPESYYDDWWYNYPEVLFGQSFICEFDGTLKSAKLYLSRTGVPTGTFRVKLYAHTGTFGVDGTPTGAPLATSDYVDASVLTDVYQLIEFTFSGAEQISLTGGTEYVIVFDRADPPGSNHVLVGIDNNSPAHVGNASWSTDGTTFVPSLSYDIIFYVYADTGKHQILDDVVSLPEDLSRYLNGNLILRLWNWTLNASEELWSTWWEWWNDQDEFWEYDYGSTSGDHTVHLAEAFYIRLNGGWIVDPGLDSLAVTDEIQLWHNGTRVVDAGTDTPTLVQRIQVVKNWYERTLGFWDWTLVTEDSLYSMYLWNNPDWSSYGYDYNLPDSGARISDSIELLHNGVRPPMDFVKTLTDYLFLDTYDISNKTIGRIFSDAVTILEPAFFYLKTKLIALVETLGLTQFFNYKPTPYRLTENSTLVDSINIGLKRYWVGGTGNWSDTAHWSRTSGGAGGASVPDAHTDAIFDANSFSVDWQTVTLDVHVNCNDLDLSAVPATRYFNFTGGLNPTNVYVYGSLAFAKYMWGGGYTKFYLSSSGTETISSNALYRTDGFYLYLDCAGTYIQQDSGNLPDLTINNGRYNANGKTVVILYSVRVNPDTVLTGTRIFDATNSTITSTISIFENTGFTMITDGSTWNVSGSMFVQGAAVGVLSMNDVNFSSVVGVNDGYAQGISGDYLDRSTWSFNNLVITGHAVRDAIVSITKDITVRGNLTVQGNSILNRLMLNRSWWSGDIDTTTITVVGTVTLSNTNFRQVTIAGSGAPYSGTSLGDMGDNGGITFTVSAARYWVGDGGNWSDTAHWSASSGGASGASVPLPQDPVVFDANSFTADSQVVVFDMATMGKGLDTSAVSKYVVISLIGYAPYIFGNFYTGIKVDWRQDGVSRPISLMGDGTSITITSNGKTITAGIAIDNAFGVVQLADDANFNGSFSVYRAEFDMNGHNLTCHSVSASISGGKFWLGEGTLTTTAGAVYAGVGADILEPETGVIIMRNPDTGYQATSFGLGSATKRIKQMIVDGNFDLEYSYHVDELIVLEGSTIERYGDIYIYGSLNLLGSSANHITETSRLGYGVTYRVYQPATVNVQYADFTGIVAIGDATFRNVNGIDNGGNTGWLFVTENLQILTESLSLTETIAKFRGAVIAFAETITAVDSAVRKTFRSLADTLGLTEIFTGDRPRYLRTKVLTEVMTISTVMEKMKVLVLQEIIAVNEIFTRRFTAIREFVENSTLLQQFATNTALVRVLTENISLTEIFDKGRRYVTVLTDSLSATASILARKVTQLLLTDTMRVTTDRLIIRFNGLMTALWGRIARQTPGFVKLVKSSTAGWNKQAKSSTGATKVAKDVGAGKWRTTPRDE